MSTVIVRNGEKLCAKCRDKGCMSHFGDLPNAEEPYESDEPCVCCELDFTTDDDLGL